ncbi:MAG: glutamate 5-kinase [Thermodesulfobacteriota bacterium]|nr:glutamate 5-kinase [Thermodesulfobacteriota bacterium]
MNNSEKDLLKFAKRVVVKIGSGVLTENHGLNKNIIQTIADQISILKEKKIEIILVSSGAIAAGVKKIGLDKRPEGIPARQAAAAVGQAGLILAWEQALARDNHKVAQLLLTRDDLSHRRRYLNARNTINRLLSWNIIPVINENDTVVIEEIKLGDNDNLAALITLLMDADLLINLTDIDGLYNKDPRENCDACLISKVTKITKEMEKAAAGIPGNLGTGGMLSKIKAAKKLNRAGIPMIIACGKEKNKGTYFIPGQKRLNSRKCWIAFNLKARGTLFLDKGAENAIRNNGKSIFPIGITSVTGDFTVVGAPVEIRTENNTPLGKGLVNYSSADINIVNNPYPKGIGA